MGRSQRKRAVIEKKDEAQPVGAAKSLERYAFPSNHDIYTRESSMLAAFEVNSEATTCFLQDSNSLSLSLYFLAIRITGPSRSLSDV